MLENIWVRRFLYVLLPLLVVAALVWGGIKIAHVLGATSDGYGQILGAIPGLFFGAWYLVTNPKRVNG